MCNLMFVLSIFLRGIHSGILHSEPSLGGCFNFRISFLLSGKQDSHKKTVKFSELSICIFPHLTAFVHTLNLNGLGAE